MIDTIIQAEDYKFEDGTEIYISLRQTHHGANIMFQLEKYNCDDTNTVIELYILPNPQQTFNTFKKQYEARLDE